jgi:hypothetical protein
LAVTDPSGWKLFADGAVLPAEEIRGYLQQGVMVFDDAAARDSTLVGALREGMIAYVKDTDTVSYYDGAAWNVITGQIAFASEAARDAAIPNPVDGRYAFTTDLNRLWLRASGAWTLLSAPGTANFSNAASGTYSDAGVDYKYVIFNATGTLTVTRAGLFDALLVAGGGGGGAGLGGGGGAGGHLSITDCYLPVGTFTVVIGAGGVGGVRAANEAKTGNNGVASSIGGKLFAPGGGAGPAPAYNFNTAAYYANVGLNGGSGGGSSAYNTAGGGAGGAGISSLGNDGGSGTGANNTGGGGGAGSAGSNGTGTAGGNGGNGAASSITGAAVTRAGGGAGAGTDTGGAGGSGGGGASGTAGTANTGGGGGGSASTPAGNGGSGVVIIRVRTN